MAPLFAPAAWAPNDTAEIAGDLVIEPRFDRVPFERGLLLALLARRAPRVEIVALGDGAARTLAVGLPAVEDAGVLARGLESVLARTIDLVLQAVRDPAICRAVHKVSDPLESGPAGTPARFFARTFSEKLRRRLGSARGRPNHWTIAVRRITDGPALAPSRSWSAPLFIPLPDDDLCFRADPFVYVHEGRSFVFFEELPYATGKGVIAMVEIDADGEPSPPHIVLELPVHTSYPQIFAFDGEIYMLPETSAAGRIELFRAQAFPDRWVSERVLIEGVVASDATLVEHAGRWWLFATVSGDGRSSWDGLCLYHAPHPFGPWTAHSGNPVLIDAGAARPAGAMWHEDGELMRIAQDCRGGYGVGIAICRVERLDADGYAQSVVARLGPPDGFGADGVHTLNRAGSLEAIDLRYPPRGR